MKRQRTAAIAGALLLPLVLSACNGDDGDNGNNGAAGASGATGAAGASGTDSLIRQTVVAAGNSQCFDGGTRIDSGPDTNGNDVLDSDEIRDTSFLCNPPSLNPDKNFNRVASFLVCSQLDANCNIDTETAAEIVAASTDGNTLIYSDSPREVVGFVDISNPNSPATLGVVALAGEPTSVAVKGNFALVGVNTSPDFINVSGTLDIIAIDSQTPVASLDLGGQPDSVAISPDGNFIAIAIENERDEDLGSGAPPQAPAGFLVIVDSGDADPANWTTRTVDLTGLADLFAGDPEPEYVDINDNNIAVLTLQENNHLVLVDLTDGSIVNHFSAGTVDLDFIDATEEDPALISLTESQTNVPREPDGVSWINNDFFATADEGDLDGGSRGFTIFNTDGEVVFTSGNLLDHLAVRFGHYPDGRSGNKGNEPENIELGVFGSDRYLFVNSERSSLIFVFDIADPRKPLLKQTLPAALGPEGSLAIPSRNLLAVASEGDDRGDKFRSVLNLYSYSTAPSQYPEIRSADRFDGTPIPWSALSGLVADSQAENTVYAVEDSFYQRNRILALDVSDTPARIVDEMTLSDADDVLASLPTATATPGAAEDDPSRADVFDDIDLANLINDDKTVNLDPEGIATASAGGFWIVSEGAGTIGDAARPINSLNFLIKTDSSGVIENVITLPAAENAVQLRFGFEGVAEFGGSVYVAFQREWDGEANVRLGIYDIAGDSWSFLAYPLDAVESQNGGWVGLSEITPIGNGLGGGEFLVIERDNQAGPDAAIKRLYRFDVTGLVPTVDPALAPVVSKTLVRDVLADLANSGGLVAEKIEGSALLDNGDVLLVNDNDGVDDHSGETRLLNLGRILD